MAKKGKKIGKVPAAQAGAEDVAHHADELAPDIRRRIIRSDDLRGVRGIRGEKGEQGRRGRRGLKGDTGVPARPGLPGQDGQDGQNGQDGPPGAAGDSGRQGDVGAPGPQGQVGPTPAHKWNGTKLSFEQPDGAFGREVNLKGDTGGRGASGRASGSAANFHLQTKDVTIQLPAIGDNIRYFFTDKRIGVKKIVFVLQGVPTANATVSIRFGDDRSSVGTELIVGGTLVSDQVAGQTIEDFDNAVIPANSHIAVLVSAVTDAPREVAATLFYS